MQATTRCSASSSSCLLLSGVWVTYGVFTKKFTDYDEVDAARPPTSGCSCRSAPTSRSAACRSARSSPSRPTPTARRLTLGLYPDERGHDPGQRDRLDRAEDAVRREVRLADRARGGLRRRASQVDAVIERTDVSTEVEQVLTDLYPLLRAVQPAEINMTLNAIATALEGRGDQLGDNLEIDRQLPQAAQPRDPGARRGPAAHRPGLRHLRRRAARGRHDPAQHHHHHADARGSRGEAQRPLPGHRRASPRPPSASSTTTATTSSASASSAATSWRLLAKLRPRVPLPARGHRQGR